MNNIIKTFNNETQEFDRQDVYYPIARCTTENFENTDFEKQYFVLKRARIQYCVDQHEEVYLQGTKDSEVLKQDHAYIVYEVWRCNDVVGTKDDGDPECAPERMMLLKDRSTDVSVDIKTLVDQGADLRLYEEDLEADTIDNWVRYKKAALVIINQKIDFTTFSQYAVRYNELYAPTVPLAYPSYSDTGYRHRYNVFERDDGYILANLIDNVFFDYFEFNTDTFQSPPDGKDNLIAELYFRLEVD